MGAESPLTPEGGEGVWGGGRWWWVSSPTQGVLFVCRHASACGVGATGSSRLACGVFSLGRLRVHGRSLCVTAMEALWVHGGGYLAAQWRRFGGVFDVIYQAHCKRTPAGDFHARRRCHATWRYVPDRHYTRSHASSRTHAHAEGPQGVCGGGADVCMPLARVRERGMMVWAWARSPVCAREWQCGGGM